jgi:hypothetical protein
VIDRAGHWSGGKTILVQMGDIADRGAETLDIVASLRALQKEAPRAGGQVIVLTGNHEAMNLLGDLRYVSPGEFAAFTTPRSAAIREQYFAAHKAAIEKTAQADNPSLSPAAIHDSWIAATPLGWAEHQAAWGPDGDIGRWIEQNPAIARVGKTVFVHGGISIEFARAGVDSTNRRVAVALAAGDHSEASVLTDPLGPLWYRGLVAKDPDAIAARGLKGSPVSAEAELRAVLAAIAAKHLVVAHTPSLSGIQILYGGALARIDTGNSRYYHGQPSWLEIVGDTLTPHAVERTKP